MNPIPIARRFFITQSDSLTRFALEADPEAFADLVHEFGPLVFATCRRILGPTPDAEDAFQAVFLTLARRAASIRNSATLPAWLHRVALRISRKALARRRPQGKSLWPPSTCVAGRQAASRVKAATRVPLPCADTSRRV